MARANLLVEGWRWLPHSYAMVNQWQLLSLMRRSEIELRVRDLPFHQANWQAQRGLMEPVQEAALFALPPPEDGFVPDLTLRLGFPFDLSPPPVGRLAVFGTSEAHALTADSWAQPVDDQARARKNLTLVTCSQWSAQGFLHAGFTPAQIAIVPLGVDLDTFKPDAPSGAAVRQRLGIGPGIVFMNASAMTANKGIDLLLRAFAELCQRRSDVYLLLKGTDQLYQSDARVQAALDAFSPPLRALLAQRVIYSGATLATAEMAALYRAADVYVSPYRAEGFNLPVLEAMASGLPVICTAGGSTDDFVSDDCALRIASRRVTAEMSDGTAGVQLLPGIQHLTSLLVRAAEDGAWRQSAGAAARRQAANFAWDKIVDRLLAALF